MPNTQNDSALIDQAKELGLSESQIGLDLDQDIRIAAEAAQQLALRLTRTGVSWAPPFRVSALVEDAVEDLQQLAYTIQEIKEQLALASVVADWAVRAEQRHLHPTAKGLDDESLGWYVKSAAAAARSFINRRDLSEAR